MAAAIVNIRVSGNSLLARYDDGTVLWFYPTPSGTWIPGHRTATTDPGGGTGIYNPWSSYTISGTWADHMSYSAGGIDYPLPYGTPLAAPAAGTLQSRDTGGLGETDTGWVGSAGRRSMLVLDQDYPRINPTMETGEGSGDMHAIIFQHQSELGADGVHFERGEIVGVSGASADGNDYGGDVHLHVHGLNAAGARVDFLNFIP